MERREFHCAQEDLQFGNQPRHRQRSASYTSRSYSVKILKRNRSHTGFRSAPVGMLISTCLVPFFDITQGCIGAGTTRLEETSQLSVFWLRILFWDYVDTSCKLAMSKLPTKHPNNLAEWWENALDYCGILIVKESIHIRDAVSETSCQ